MNPHILTTIFNMSVEASILICVICIFRFIFKKAPKWITCALWGIAGLKLVIPFSVDSIVGILPSRSAVELNSDGTSLSFSSEGVQHIVDRVITPAAADIVRETNISSEQFFVNFMCKIWTVGFIIMVLYAIVSYIRIFIKVGESIKSDKVYICDKIDTPFILGFFKPKIYVPSGIDGSSFGAILAHETAHIRRMDHWWKPVGYLILSVYWFNPLVWAAYILLCRDIEFACDEKVIANMSAEDIADYSQALLNVSKSVRMVTACPVAFGETGVKQRIKSALNYKKPSFWIIIAAVIAAVSLTLVFATNHKKNVEPDVPKADESTVYIDEESELEYGYYHCYYYSDLTGSKGIAKKNAKGDISVLIMPEYDSVRVVSQNRFIVEKLKNGKTYSAMLDLNGNAVVPEFAGDIRWIGGTEGKPIYCVDASGNKGTCRFIDGSGSRISEENFTNANNTPYGLFFGINESGYSFFDENSKLIKKASVGEKAVFKIFDLGLSLVINCNGDCFGLEYGVLNKSGKMIIPCEYSRIVVYPDKKRIVARKGEDSGLEPTDVADIFDLSGNKLTNGEYSNISLYENSYNGIAAIMHDDFSVSIVVIDVNGKKVSKYYDYDQLAKVMDEYAITEFPQEAAEESTTAAAVIIDDSYTKPSKETKSTIKVQSLPSQKEYVIDSVTVDYDDDGVKETIQVLPGPTSGILSFTVKIIDGKSEEVEDFRPENQAEFNNIRLELSGNKVYLVYDIGGSTEKYQVMLNHNVIVLKNGEKEMPYLTEKIKFYLTDKSGKETEISDSDSLDIYYLLKRQKAVENNNEKGNIKMRFGGKDYFYNSDSGYFSSDSSTFALIFSENDKALLNKILAEYTDI